MGGPVESLPSGEPMDEDEVSSLQVYHQFYYPNVILKTDVSRLDGHIYSNHKYPHMKKWHGA